MADIPMQLLIGACIIAFCAPIFQSSLEDISENIATSRMDSEVEDLLKIMEQVLSGDRGSRLNADISVKGAGTCSVTSFSLGGSLSEGTDQYIIRYELTSGLERRFTLDPPVPICSDLNTTLELGSGEHELSVQLKEDDGIRYLEVSFEE